MVSNRRDGQESSVVNCCLVEVEVKAVLGNRRDSQPVGHAYSAAAG